jgi:hypothetical protein
MSLLEKIYEDLKRVMKHIIIGGIIVSLLWCMFITMVMSVYWGKGKYFIAILTVFFGLFPFYLFSGFVGAFFRFRELRWGRLIVGLIFVLIALLFGIPAMEGI